MRSHFLLPGLLAGMIAIPAVQADDGPLDFFFGRPGVNRVDNERYAAECGACHVAYQPGLLPARSWSRIMGNLADHFGDNAELDPEVAGEIRRYLETNAADLSDSRLSKKLVRSIAGETPIRITEIPYIRHEHAEIPVRYLKNNRDINSFSQCEVCHTDLAEGTFREGAIRIPGVGRWED